MRNAGGTLKYEYNITDQQGNVWVSFEEDQNGNAKIIQENHYYAFGLAMKGSIIRTAIPVTANKNLYNGMSELQDDFGDDPNYYSTFFREYDPVPGRMNAIDPMADKYGGYSPYNYSFNDPVNLNDPSGAEPPGGNPGFNEDTWALISDVWDEFEKTEYGIRWQEGDFYEYQSSTDAFYAASAYNDNHDSWGNTFAGSYGEAASNFNVFASLGAKGTRYVSTTNRPEYLNVIGHFYHEKNGKPITINGLSGSAYVLKLSRSGDVIANKGGGSEKGWADNVGLADVLLGPLGGGADNILQHRGMYLPRNEVYRGGREIMVRTPIANIRTTSKVLNYARVGGKVLGVAGVAATGYQIYGDIDKGNYYSAGARTAVAGIAAGAAFIPVVGWGVAAGIGVADYVWGDQFYNYIETKMK